MTSDDDRTHRLTRPGEAATDGPTSPESEVGDGLAVGAVVADYRVVRELGRGGMGVVYLAEDSALRRKVALKILPGGADAASLARFRREAEAASRLDHPNLCSVYGAGRHGGLRWIAMRYVEGETLEAKLKRGRAAAKKNETIDASRTWRDAVRVVEIAARAAHAAHECGVVHRDLKPHNIMIQQDGTPVVLDFGLAQDGSDDGLTRTGDVLGTPSYMAPEQVRGESRAADRRADVWALGVVLYEATTLRRPFDGPTREALWRAILERDPAPLRAYARGVPRDLETVAVAALAKEPARRYATALDLAEDLQAVLETRPVAAKAPSLVSKATLYAKRKPAAAALTTLLFLGLPTAAALLVSGAERADRLARLAATRVTEIEDALRLRRADAAETALAALRGLDPSAESLPRLDAALARRRLLDALEARVFDVDADPTGRLATEALDRASADRPGDPEITVLRALLVARVKSPAEAAAALKDAGPAFAAYAEKCAEAAEAERAAAAASRATSRPTTRPFSTTTDDLDLAFFEARLLMARGDDRAALARLERLLERAPNRAWIAWAAADAAAKTHDHHAALAFAGRAKAGGGAGSPERLARYSTHLRRAGLTDEAIRVAAEAAKAGGETPPLLLHLANAYGDARRPLEAEALLRRAVAADPAFAEARSALGAVLFERGMFEESIEASRASLDLRDDGGVRVNLGNALIEAKRPKEAETELRRALESRPDSAYAWNSLGTALMHQERFDEAEAAFAKAADLLPNYAQATASLGVLLQRKGDLVGAERKLRAALSIAPDDPSILYRLATLRFDEDKVEAENLLRRAREVAPHDPDVLSKLAETLAQTGRFDEAEPLIVEATETRPGAMRPWLVRALICAGLERIDEGALYMRRAVETQPNDPALHLAVVDAGMPCDPVEAYARLMTAIALEPRLEPALDARVDELADRLKAVANAETPSGPDAEFATHPLARALAAAASGDKSRVEAAKKDVEALPDGPPGSTARVIRAAALRAVGAP
jgi:tetratricopeptide (TPR) repeat protein/predicted Ser/Thr protein kinase